MSYSVFCLSYSEEESGFSGMNMEEQRTKRDRVFRAARRVHGELQQFMDNGEYIKLNIHTITNRGTEFTTLSTRILSYMDAL